MPFPIMLDVDAYETLVAFARAGTLDAGGTPIPEKARELESWLKGLEFHHGIVRHFVLVQWQEQDSPLPSGTTFPTKWPPELRASISLTTRPIARADVDMLLASKARNPTYILVTTDPAGLLGWTTLDVFFK